MPEQKAIQVRLDAALLDSFRAYADQEGRSMAGILHRWIEQAVAGTAPTPVSPTSTPATEIPSSGDVLAAQVDLLSSLLEQAVLQTQLLQQLTHQAATTPHGGTEPRRVVITEPEVIPSGSVTAFTGFADHGEPEAATSTKSVEAAVVSPPVKVQSTIERVMSPPAFSEEQAQAFAPCESRVLYAEPDYEQYPGRQEVEIQLSSGVVVTGHAVGKTSEWVQVSSHGSSNWPDAAKNMKVVVAPASVCTWPDATDA